MFPYMDIVYHKYKSNSPNTTDNQQLVKILAGAEKTGGMTPRVARMILEDILSVDLPGFEADFPADVPFSLTVAKAMKNEGNPDAAVTKYISKLFAPDNDEGDETGAVFEAECTKCGNTELVTGIEKSEDPLVDYLVRLNKRIEAKWEQAVKAAEEAESEAQLWAASENAEEADE